MEAHAMTIDKCVECPFGAGHNTHPEAEFSQCTHPDRWAGEDLMVRLERPPPKACPLRVKALLLRVIVPAPAGLRVVK